MLFLNCDILVLLTQFFCMVGRYQSRWPLTQFRAINSRARTIKYNEKNQCFLGFFLNQKSNSFSRDVSLENQEVEGEAHADTQTFVGALKLHSFNRQNQLVEFVAFPIHSSRHICKRDEKFTRLLLLVDMMRVNREGARN